MTFNLGTVVITGFTLPVATSTITRDVTATVVPPECADDVDLVIASAPRATLIDRVNNTTTGIITFKVKGISATPTTGSDTVLQARCGVGGELLASVPVTVMIPKAVGTPHPTVDPAQAVNGVNQVQDASTSPAYFGALAPNEVVLLTWFGVVQNVPVFNQFGAILDPIYAGVPVDELDGTVWKPINQNMTANGTYSDPVYAFDYKGGGGPYIVLRGSAEANSWPTDPRRPCFNSNYVPGFIGVRVGGHVLNPGVANRLIELTTPPCKIRITWP